MSRFDTIETAQRLRFPRVYRQILILVCVVPAVATVAFNNR